MCLRSRESNQLEEDNMLTFVMLHEAAHCATPLAADPHSPEFWANFKFLLAAAVEAGVWTKQDFKAHPRRFCGVPVTDSPL